MESIGRSRPSSEGSSERPDFGSGEGSSSKPSHSGKRKRGQGHSKRRQGNSFDLEASLIIVEEVSGTVDEPPEKRSREEETTGDGMILPFSFLFLLFSFLCVISCLDLFFL